VLIRNDPRKENLIFIRCFILKTFRFSFTIHQNFVDPYVVNPFLDEKWF